MESNRTSNARALRALIWAQRALKSTLKRSYERSPSDRALVALERRSWALTSARERYSSSTRALERRSWALVTSGHERSCQKQGWSRAVTICCFVVDDGRCNTSAHEHSSTHERSSGLCSWALAGWYFSSRALMRTRAPALMSARAPALMRAWAQALMRAWAPALMSARGA